MSAQQNIAPWPALPPPLQLFMLSEGAVIATALSFAAELGIADLLADGLRTDEELANITSTHPRALYRVLRLLSALGVFTERQPHQFALTAIGELLRSDTSGSMRSWVRMINSKAWLHTYAEADYSLRTGEPAFKQAVGASFFEYLAAHPEEGAIFNDAMSGITAEATAAILEAYDFSGIDLIVDLGGGHGRLITAVLQAYPEMRGILFDLPQVVKGANSQILEAGLAQRCEIVGGDFFSSIPGDGDAYVLKLIIHDWHHDQALAILQNCRRVMNKTGRLLLIEAVIPEGDAFDPGKFVDFAMLTGLGGQERTEAEYSHLLDSAGFCLNQVVPTASPMSLIEAVPK